MRADRLLSLLMLLQARGRLTAAELAAELEVSQRTIYRDMDALSVAGVPIYGEPGPDGGYGLLESYRTNLTGLTSDEIRALFMLSIPAPLDDLGVTEELRAALRKLAAAIPDARRGDEERARQRIHLDARWWSQGHEPVPHLSTLQTAVWEDRCLRLTYRHYLGFPIELVVEPYALVAKAGVWHLVYRQQGEFRVLEASSLLDAEPLSQRFGRIPDMDLARFWRGWCAEQETRRVGYVATVRVSPGLAPYLSFFLGGSAQRALRDGSAPDEAGWVTIELRFESLFDARSRLLGMGAAVEVVAPEPLRQSLADYARQIAALYDDK